MSCETNANKVSQSLTVAGVSRSAGKGAYATAATIRKLGKVGVLVGVAAAGTALSAAALHPQATKAKVADMAAPARQTLLTAQATVDRHITAGEEAVATAGQKAAPAAGVILKGLNTPSNAPVSPVAPPSLPSPPPVSRP